ncbi:MAG TPA: wax ester/triacylglycerol synthase domain-containing protein [Dermatophilaceae bacterium]|nr:wax ester/triacylglycerol synthase domain-containing protein [Dermatophilaceae bacterium]
MGWGLSSGQPPRVDRISPNDLTNLAVDHGPVPMNIAAVLVIGDAGDLALPDVRSLLGERLPRVPRMRQRLVRATVGSGRPYWVDDASFSLDRHLRAVELTGVHTLARDPDARLLHVAADLVCRRLPHDRPLWNAAWVTGLDGGAAALVLVVHHVLADGLGGLAVLGALADGGAEAARSPFPAPPPGRRQLSEDAWRERARALRGIRAGLSGSAAGLRELGLAGRRPTLAPATSLNRPTGPRRRLTTVAVPLDEVVDLAHARHCTVNDVVLTAIVGAMAGTLRLRGERPTELVVSVPISSRAGTTADQLGNQTGVVPMSLPTLPDPHERLARVTAISRERRRGPRGASAGPMGLVFRAVGRLGLFQAFINRQRLVNTFVTNVRGPAAPLSLDGHRVSAVIPVAVNPGNVGVSFDVLSYAGRLGVTVVADPEVVPDQDQLTRLLSDEVTALLSTGR